MLLKISKAIGLALLVAAISHIVVVLLLIVVVGVAAALFVPPMAVLSCFLIAGSVVWSIVAIFIPAEKAER
jgi:hypothetical protein